MVVGAKGYFWHCLLCSFQSSSKLKVFPLKFPKTYWCLSKYHFVFLPSVLIHKFCHATYCSYSSACSIPKCSTENHNRNFDFSPFSVLNTYQQITIFCIKYTIFVFINKSLLSINWTSASYCVVQWVYETIHHSVSSFKTCSYDFDLLSEYHGSQLTLSMKPFLIIQSHITLSLPLPSHILKSTYYLFHSALYL